MNSTASVELLSTEETLPRSSHSLALINDVLYILGGEVSPREPASPFLHVFNLKDGSLKPLESEPSPPLRVGAASVVVEGKIYLWGGRGGKAMTPLEEGGKFWIFDPRTSVWARTPDPSGNIPEPRSYHCLAAIDDKIYLHAGCPSKGRLSTLHVYSIAENTWMECASAPGSPRGGTSIAALGSFVLRYGGFNGEELGGSVDVFHPDTNSWTSRPFTSGPGNRSVTTFLPHPAFPTTKAILAFGEKSPSSDGHNAAGTFWNDIWIYHYEGDQWEKAQVENAHVLTEGGCGWGAGTPGTGGVVPQIVVWGGLNDRNDRIGRGWRIKFSSG